MKFDDDYRDIHRITIVNSRRTKGLDPYLGIGIVHFTTEELRVLSEHNITPMFIHSKSSSRKEYLSDLKLRDQARIWLEEEKQAKAQQSNEEVME